MAARSFREIRDAIEGVDRVIAVVGPAAISWQYVRYEWDHALLFAKGIVPILRLGTYELLPEELPGENAEGLARTDLTKLPRFSSGTPIPRRASPNSSRSYTSQWRLSAPARRERPAVSQSGSR